MMSCLFRRSSKGSWTPQSTANNEARPRAPQRLTIINPVIEQPLQVPSIYGGREPSSDVEDDVNKIQKDENNTANLNSHAPVSVIQNGSLEPQKKKAPAPQPQHTAAPLETGDDEVETPVLAEFKQNIKTDLIIASSTQAGEEIYSQQKDSKTEDEDSTSGGNLDSEDEVSQNTRNDSMLSVASMDETERKSIDVQIRRRSGIIPRPVTIDEKSINKIPKHPKSSSDEELIRQALISNEFLGRLLKEGKRLEDVISAMYSQNVVPDQVIIQEGETGSHMYVSAEGNFQVMIKNKGVVGNFDDARVFGELALLHNSKRLATISATTHGKIWVLNQNVYNQLMVRTNIEEQDEILSFLQKVDKLNTVRLEVLRHVAKLLKLEYYPGDTKIVRQGESGDKFYIIRAGSVTITKENEGVVNKYQRSKYFGELALLKEDTRQATVIADPPGVECFTLTRKQFIKHFGEVDDIANITIDAKPKISVMNIPSQYGEIDLMDLEIKATLGVGGFGRVELVQHKDKPDLTFALKYLKKYDMVLQEQQEHVKNERNIQISCSSNFIVRLYRTYKDDKYVYFLMETCLGGDLWSLLQKQKNKRFEEKNARFIAGCVLEAIAYLHERDVIYRDLKPENLMIDSEGYIKLTDFGFAKKLPPSDKTYTFAGTPEYVAPEIVLNRGHDKSVDYWAFGIFIYELLSGRTPFRTGDPNHMKTYNRILTGINSVQFPKYILYSAKNIIEKLCRPLPTERFGYQRGGVKDIRNHKWFLGFDWDKLKDRQMHSPFKPRLNGPIDTQYFDTFKKDLDIPPDEFSGWDKDF